MALTLTPRALPLLLALGLQTSHASPDWHWQFDTASLNLAVQRTVTATFTNTATSDAPVYLGGLLLSSFGDQGLLYEPGFRGIVTPVNPGGGPVGVLPGESVTRALIEFVLLSGNLPSPGIAYEILPVFGAWYGSGCNIELDVTACTPDNRAAARPLLVTYAPVPDAPTWALWAVGAALLAGRARWRRPAGLRAV